MTIEFIQGALNYSLYLNVANVSPGVTQTLQITSQASNTEILSVPFTIDTTNDRYTKISFEIAVDLPAKHLNSVANYAVLINDALIDQGIIKIVTNPGGTTYTENYISTNETRQSKVYYRPEY